MSPKHTRKCSNQEEEKLIRHFKLKPAKCFNNVKLPTNRDVLQRFFDIQDCVGKYHSKVGKQGIAIQIYHEISEKYAMITCSMKRQQTCIKNILMLNKDYYEMAKNIKNF